MALHSASSRPSICKAVSSTPTTPRPGRTSRARGSRAWSSQASARPTRWCATRRLARYSRRSGCISLSPARIGPSTCSPSHSADLRSSIARNGDTANKISTYQIAQLCSAPHPYSPNLPRVPVLVAAPITTLDLDMASGRSIVIEQRPGWEACTVRGRVVDVAHMSKHAGVLPVGEKVEVATVLVTPPNTIAWNPYARPPAR